MVVAVVKIGVPSSKLARFIVFKSPSFRVTSSSVSILKAKAIAETKTSRAANAEIRPKPTRQSTPMTKSRETKGS